jgi:signal transduction histidine kinase/ligand-binding sensor domain-containing protein/DNA-binding response OmpR family regulator
MEKRLLFLVMLCFILLPASLPGQTPVTYLRFTRISLEQGLSQTTVTCILQDCKGLMWIGTQDGLNRYDGYEFKVYKNDPQDPTTLSDDEVYCIHEDHSGILWVGTKNGLNRFRRENEQFIVFRHQPENLESLSHNAVWCIHEDSDGVLWLGTTRGLSCFDPISRQFQHYIHGKKKDDRFNVVNTICEDSSGMLWIGTDSSGLLQFDPGKRQFTAHYFHEVNNPHSLSNNIVKYIYEDRAGTLWIGTKEGGLNRFDPEKGRFTHYTHEPDNPNSLSDISVRAIYEDRSGRFWIGTKRGGLDLLNRETGRFTHFQHDPTDPNSLSHNSAFCIYEDRGGMLWIGTKGDGLNRFDPATTRFALYRHDPLNPNSPGSNYVTCISEKQVGIIWIGTFGGGLSRFDRKNGFFTHFRHDPAAANSLSHNDILSIYEDQEGILWIGTYGGGLDRFDPATGRFTHYTANGSPFQLSNNEISHICEDRRGVLWIGTLGGGLNKFNQDTGRFTSYKHNPQDPHSLSQDSVSCIYKDRSGHLWLGTHTGGLNLFHPDRGQFTRYQHNPQNPNSLSQNHIWCIHEDRMSRLWIGTRGGGLNMLDRDTGNFKTFREKDGLPNDTIYGILEDPAGNLWISTNKGLSRFNPGNRSFKNFNMEDGLQSNEFNARAYLQNQQGEMFFGGVKGLNAFFPDQIKDNPCEPPVIITNFFLFNQPVRLQRENPGSPLQKSILETKSMTLSYKESLISFEFSALHYANPKRNQYAYQLEGWDKDWIPTDWKMRRATYTNLPAGNYVFRVKASNKDGVWNETGTSINLEILPPPWKTWWAYTLYILALVGLTAWFVWTQRRKVNRERAINQRLRQVDRLKDEFLSNTSHELRTPLHGIIGITESLINGATGCLPEKTLSNLQMVVHSSKRLNNLVNDILDYSKLKEKDLELQMKPVDIKTLTEVVLIISRPLAASKPLQLINNIDSDVPLVYGDENRLQQIMHNLVGNAIKFTESGTISVSAVKMEEQPIVMVKVTDTGIGIPGDKFKTIFQSFEQVDASIARTYGGTGLGLSITRQLVELHGGAIGVESEVGKGSTFWFTLQVWRQEFQVGTRVAVSDTQPLELIPLEPTAGPGEDTPVVKTGHDKEKYRILAVDDELINLQVLTNHLSLHGYTVSKALNGGQALEIIQTPGDKTDMVLLDVMMPRLSGYEVCRRIRQYYSPSELPIIMLTAKTQMIDIVEGLDSGANDYITKPFSSEELLERIRVHLELLNANRQLKNANEKLEDYSQTLELKVTERTRDLKEKNRLILDSMYFAQRIQNSILPLEEKIITALPEHFIIFKPKDIVSGDFYWFEQVEDKIFVAVVDCTGHGVPGALMAMTGTAFLNKLVNEHQIYEPDLILENLHKEIITAFKQKKQGMRHVDTAGMDMCLCMIEKDYPDSRNGNKIIFAGAHLPLYIVKSGAAAQTGKEKEEVEFEVVEIKGDRKSIGGLQLKEDTGEKRRFIQKEVYVHPGDMIYLTSDGFAHQNNSKDEKYGKKRLKDFLKGIAGLSMKEQKKKLVKELASHIGNENQRDDITLLGMRIPSRW